MDIQKQHEDFDLWWENNAIAMMCEEDEALKIWQAAKAQAVPEGFVLVPKEPTQKMIDAGMGNFDFPLDNGRFSNHDLIFAYRAMIEAQEQK